MKKVTFDAVLEGAMLEETMLEGQSSVLKRKENVLSKYRRPEMLKLAQDLLNAQEQSEEAFLGAQGVLLLNGLL